MRYMLEATEEVVSTFPTLMHFALVGDTANDAGTLREAWRGKGVQPLVYPASDHDHGALYRTLSAWGAAGTPTPRMVRESTGAHCCAQPVGSDGRR